MRRFLSFVVQDAVPELEHDPSDPSHSALTSNSPSSVSPSSIRSTHDEEPSATPAVSSPIKHPVVPTTGTYGSFDTTSLPSQPDPNISQSPVTETGDQTLASPNAGETSEIDHLESADVPEEQPPAEPKSTVEITSPSDNEVPLPTPAELQLRNLIEVLSEFTNRADDDNNVSKVVSLVSSAAVVNSLRELAEVMVWADQHQVALWDVFMECSVMPLLVSCLQASLVPIPNVSAQNAIPESAIFTSDVTNEIVAMNGNTDPPGNPQETTLTSSESRTNDMNPLLQPVREARSQTVQNLPRYAIEYQDATVLDSSSLQDLVMVVPEPSLSAPTTSASHAGQTSEYDTFRTSQSTPASTMLSSDDPNNVTQPVNKSLAIAVEVQSQILQTLSIIVQSVSRQESLLYLFSSNHINDILSFPFSFDSEEMLGLLMSMIKTITLKLDSDLLQLFFNPTSQSFTLYSVVIQFYNHPESMVRIAVRNVTLTLCNLGNEEVLKLIADDDSSYLHNSIALLTKLCGSVARAFDLLLDDGREVRRSRARAWLFRQNVRISDVIGKLEEIENLCAYLGDMVALSEVYLQPVINRLLGTEVFIPLFSPLASQACPEAIRLMQRNRWALTSIEMKAPNQKPALTMFDATARTLLLTFLLSCSKTSIVGYTLIQELTCPVPHFDNRYGFQALKSLCAQVSATERVTFISLLAIEAALSCESMTADLIHGVKCDFEGKMAHTEIQRDEADRLDAVLDTLAGGEDVHPRLNENGEMVMTLKGFDVPMTPSTSMPTTPTTPGLSPNAHEKSSSFFFRALSSSSVDDTNGGVDGINGQEILTSLQNGTASLGKVLSSVILVVRRREVRTKRVLDSICRLLSKVGELTQDWDAMVDLAKLMLDELAKSLKSFLKNKNTTIVSIECAFDNFCKIGDDTPSSDEGDTEMKDKLNVMKPLSVDRTPQLVSERPRGAGKRRRASADGVAAPVEIEDAETLFAIMECYELGLRKAKNGAGVISVIDAVKGSLEGCAADDSYLDKRDALESVADVIIRHGDLA